MFDGHENIFLDKVQNAYICHLILLTPLE